MNHFFPVIVAAMLASATVLVSCSNDLPEPFSTTGVPAQLLDAASRSVAELVDEGIVIDDLTVIRAEAVTWPDGSLGCPEVDMMYTQALVPGYRIIVSTPTGEIAFHGAIGANPKRCADPKAPAT